MLVIVEYFRAAARRRLPGIAFDAIDGGDGDELALERNRSVYRQIEAPPEAVEAVAGEAEVFVDGGRRQRVASKRHCRSHQSIRMTVATERTRRAMLTIQGGRRPAGAMS